MNEQQVIGACLVVGAGVFTFIGFVCGVNSDRRI